MEIVEGFLRKEAIKGKLGGDVVEGLGLEN